MRLVRHISLVMGKDFLLAWKARGRLSGLVFFSGCALLIFSFALGPDTAVLQRSFPALLWLTVFFASSIALNESFRLEVDNGALDALRAMPIDARALFVGKALVNACVLAAVATLLVPLCIALFDVRLQGSAWSLLATIALGCAAISGSGTAYAAIATLARAKDLLLPILLFPALVPVLLAVTKATVLIAEGDPMNQLSSWLSLLAGFCGVYWSVAFALFPRLIEDVS